MTYEPAAAPGTLLLVKERPQHLRIATGVDRTKPFERAVGLALPIARIVTQH
jgi:hypothetical protein